MKIIMIAALIATSILLSFEGACCVVSVIEYVIHVIDLVLVEYVLE